MSRSHKEVSMVHPRIQIQFRVEEGEDNTESSLLIALDRSSIWAP